VAVRDLELPDPELGPGPARELDVRFLESHVPGTAAAGLEPLDVELELPFHRGLEDGPGPEELEPPDVQLVVVLRVLLVPENRVEHEGVGSRGIEQGLDADPEMGLERVCLDEEPLVIPCLRPERRGARRQYQERQPKDRNHTPVHSPPWPHSSPPL